MSYKSIATVVHNPASAMPYALEYAIQAARRWQAHLHVLCLGVDSTDPGFYYGGAHAIAVQHTLEKAQADATELGEIIERRLEREDITWDVEIVSMMHNGLDPFLADHMRFHDLALLPVPTPAGGTVDGWIFEACLFGADIPVLVVPGGADVAEPVSQLIVAWDDSQEALSAARAATPIIQQAARTEICVIDPSQISADRSDPGGRLAQLLARAGGKVEVTVHAQLRPEIADQLLQRASETGADLIVMGAYGHSRLRESILGGVTRSMLAKTTVPILMAH